MYLRVLFFTKVMILIKFYIRSSGDVINAVIKLSNSS
jgi:hypothetical protein